MSLRGLRKIVVGEVEYLWKKKGVTVVVHKRKRLIIDTGWVNVWLHVGDLVNLDPPIVVTPSLVRRGIEYAIAHNWEKEMKLLYKNDQFSIIPANEHGNKT